MSSGEPLPPEAFRALLREAAPPFQVELSSDSEDSLAFFLAELDVWRRRSNLTGRLSPEELVFHALESALGASILPPSARVIDIGSGAGFPGLPLAILRRDVDLTALEPRGKRASFLRHAGRVLDLPNFAVLQASIEGLRDPAWTAATTRAVGRLPELIGKASFLGPGGLLLVWTTAAEELERKLIPVFAPVETRPVPGSRRRLIALFRKVTPDVPRGTSPPAPA